MAAKKKAYQPGDVYHGMAERNRYEIELVSAESHVITVTEGEGKYRQSGIEVSVAEDSTSAAYIAHLSREQATELFDALAEILDIDYTGIGDAE